MTEEKKAPEQVTEPVVVVAGQIADEKGVMAEGAVATQGDHALIIARFADQNAAMATYQGLVQGEIDGTLAIEGVLVVNADANGKLHVQKMTEHSTRTGLAWGIVGGVVAGIFLPATIIGGAIALGAAGAAAGKARNLYHRTEVEKELADVITAGTSGILALVSATAVEDVRLKMPEAQEVKSVPVSDEAAGAIKEVAEAAGPEPQPAHA